MPLKWHERAWFSASLVLTGVSLASALDSFLAWPSILSPLLFSYRELVSAIFTVLLSPLGLTNSHFLSQPLEQLFVLMGGVFCSMNAYTLQTEGQTVFRRFLDMSMFQGGTLYRWYFAVTRSLALYVLGPMLCVYLCYVAVIKGAPYQDVMGFSFQPMRIFAYYASLVSGVFALLWLATLAPRLLE